MNAEKRDIMEQENFDWSEWERLYQEGEEKIKKEQRSAQLCEWGKLGGGSRPVKGKDEKKVRISFRVSESEKMLIDKKVLESEMSLSEYLRSSALSSKIQQRPKVDTERNKILVEYRLNFIRLFNFIESRIWNEEEKLEFKKELRGLIRSLQEELQKKTL